MISFSKMKSRYNWIFWDQDTADFFKQKKSRHNRLFKNKITTKLTFLNFRVMYLLILLQQTVLLPSASFSATLTYPLLPLPQHTALLSWQTQVCLVQHRKVSLLFNELTSRRHDTTEFSKLKKIKMISFLKVSYFMISSSKMKSQYNWTFWDHDIADFLKPKITIQQTFQKQNHDKTDFPEF